MSDETTAPTNEHVEAESPKPAPPAQDEADKTDWKAEARKWESRAKENSKAADRLTEIEESQKSEADKAAERLAAAEERASTAEARAARRDVAIEFSLTSEDAALLDTISDGDAMRALAERLSAANAGRKMQSNVVPSEGNNPRPEPDGRQQFAEFLTGNRG